ncbi:AI-2E family transporter [Sphingosinicella sp. BN140058]|uniref:AI-2E family transporter n=1 Tax=Sphingosinicella sp. BN140058 TaxID=1892855 RepID=UPI001012D9A6|nr:AI-2E family transporter [Sphingosinicella sp. BN140058]QAY77971.1 AI-2E family transporter [Sphingosinicella sp. BN140058]
MPHFAEQADQISHDTPPVPPTRDNFERRVFRATAIVLATLAAAYVLWQLVDLLLLLFACTLVSLILLTITNAIRRRTHLPFGIALGLSVLGLILLIGSAFTFFGTTLQGEFAELAARLPAAWADVEARLNETPAGAALLERAQALVPSGQALVNTATKALAAVGGGLSGLAIVLVGGLYLAAQPTLYAGGLLRLVPDASRARVAETLDAVTVSLRNWLKGQALGMVFVGIATGLGLWLVGVPAAWAIGLVAGMAEFVPYLGIFVAVIPATVLGFGQGIDTGLWTVAVLVGVQQIQGNLVMPLLQNRMVDLPPAITIFGIIAAGILFGVAGVLLATPLTIVVLVLVRRLYLGEDKQEVLASGDAPSPPPPPATSAD